MYWIYPNRLFVICLAAPAKSEMKRFQKTSNALVSLPNETWKTGICRRVATYLRAPSRMLHAFLSARFDDMFVKTQTGTRTEYWISGTESTEEFLCFVRILKEQLAASYCLAPNSWEFEGIPNECAFHLREYWLIFCTVHPCKVIHCRKARVDSPIPLVFLGIFQPMSENSAPATCCIQLRRQAYPVPRPEARESDFGFQRLGFQRMKDWWVDTTTLGRNMNKHEILKMLHLLLSLWILGLVGLCKWIQYKWIPMEDKWCCTLAWLRNRCPRHSREKSKQMQAGLNGCLSFWKIQVPYGLATGWKSWSNACTVDPRLGNLRWSSGGVLFKGVLLLFGPTPCNQTLNWQSGVNIWLNLLGKDIEYYFHDFHGVASFFLNIYKHRLTACCRGWKHILCVVEGAWKTPC